jgi:predicted transcriptional regulator of viral defense system
MSGQALSSGIEEHVVDGTTVRVFGVAKTVADCFKFRNKIGHDVAVEALQEVVRARMATPGQILEYAEVDRVAKVVRPYLEALQ